MRKLLLLLPALSLCTVQAERTTENLQPFKTVCVNAAFEEQEKEKEAVLDDLFDQMYAALQDAKIPLAKSPCQKDGLISKGQLNLFFDFSTSPDGKAFNGVLEGWLSQDGKFKNVTLWMDNIYGWMDVGKGADEAADILDELLAGFIEDWDSSH